MSRTFSASVLLFGAAACASSPRQSPGPLPAASGAPAAARTDANRADTTFVMPPLSQFTRMSSGLMYYDVTIGTGSPAVDLREVEVHYTGKLDNGQIFDNSRERGMPIKFVLGAGRVIPGWDQGVRGMRVGGRRILVIPPALGYGAQGAPPDIPANATLTFDLTLVSVR
jgi:FKBP-type peptidyl-prolyl cis-trans isomerase